MKVQFVIMSLLLVTASACDSIKSESEQKISSLQVNQLDISVGSGPDAMFLTPDGKKLYIANVEDSSISVISTTSDKVVASISGIHNPWGFSQLGKSNEVAVSGYDKKLAVIDFSTDQVIREKSYMSHLGGIIVDRTGQYLYVVAIDEKKVVKVDANTLDSLDSYNTGNGPDGIGISKDNQKVYVTNTEDGTISIINTISKTTSIINTGGKPELVHGNHDHSLLYISNFKNDKIHIINTVTDSIIHEINGLDGPEEAVPNNKNDELYVVNFNLAKVYVYEIPSYKKLDNEYSTGNKPIGIIPVNDKIYVSNYGDNSVSVITK